MQFETKNPNLAKLLKQFGFEEVPLSLEDPQSKDVEFNIPDDSCFDKMLKNPKVTDFLKQQDDKWQKLLQSQPDDEVSQSIAFADLARLSEVTVYSGVKNFTQYFNRYLVLEPQASKYFNNNGSVPTEYVTVASASKFSKNLNFRFGESGLFFKPTCSFLFDKQDFCSAGVGDALDPRSAFQNYNENKFERENLAFDLNSIAKSLSANFYRNSTDPDLEDVREEYAKQKNKKINCFERVFFANYQEGQLNRRIAKSKGFARLDRQEAEYNEMHLPATILLSEGFFSLDCLTENLFRQYETIYNLKEFLSSNEELTQEQLDIFKISLNKPELLKEQCLQIRDNFLDNTAKYFEDIVTSHQKRVESLMQKEKIEDAIVLALQSDYFQKFTTQEAILERLKKPLNLKIFNSKTKEVEDVLQENVLPLIEKIALVEKIVKNEQVKEIDKKSLKIIFEKADLREIIKYFTVNDEIVFPAEAIDNGQVNLEKLLKIENLQEFFKPFFDYCDQTLKQKEESMKYIMESIFLMGMACNVAIIIVVVGAIPPVVLVLYAGLGVLLAVASVATVLTLLIEKEQLKELKEGRQEINKKQAFAKIVGKCYNSFTSYFIKQESQPATSLEPATIGAVVEEAVISI